MGKALLVTGNPVASWSNGSWSGALGASPGYPAAWEANGVLIVSSTGGVFSNLSFSTRTGDGWSNVILRYNMTDTMVYARKNPGDPGLANSAVANTVGVAVGDNVSIGYIRTISNPTYNHTKILWEANTGHTTPMGSYTQGICDQTVFTFGMLSGFFPNDGSQVESDINHFWGANGTLSNFWVNIGQNLAGSSVREFRVRGGSANGNQYISFPAGTTGYARDTSNTDTVTLNSNSCICLVPLSSSDDVLLLSYGVWFTNTDGTHGSDLMKGFGDNSGSNQENRAGTSSSVQEFNSIGGSDEVITGKTEANSVMRTGFSGTLSKLRVRVVSNSYGNPAKFKLCNRTTNANLDIDIPTTFARGTLTNNNTSISFSPTDNLAYVFEGGSSGTCGFIWASVHVVDTDPSPQADGSQLYWSHYYIM